MTDVVYADAHCHSNPVRGLGASKIAERFRKSGGWFISLISLSPWSYAIDFTGLDSYKEAVDIHLRECKAAEEAGMRVACIAGMHPADIDRLIDRYRLDPLEALELGLQVIDYVASLCKEGVLDGIGEVGRQHYRTSPERVAMAEVIMERAIEYARDYGCIVHLHLENQGRITAELVHRRVSVLGLPSNSRARLVFHHARPDLAREALNRGYPASVPGLPRVLEYTFKSLEPDYMIESDFIDDPARPGVVIYPWEMARNQARLQAKGLVSEEYLYKINVDNIVKVYGVEPP